MTSDICTCGHSGIVQHYNGTGWCGGYSWGGVPCPCETFVPDESQERPK